MILETQNKSTPYSSQSWSKASFGNQTNISLRVSEFGKIKQQFHQKVRIRQLEKIKAEKRKRHQTHMEIEKILQDNFPRESVQVRKWADDLIELYKSSNKYQTDPYKLRQIFLIAQKFPCFYTLRLFYLAVYNATSSNIKTLFDMDVWKFLHNHLKYPVVNQSIQQNTVSNDQNLFFSNSQNSTFKIQEVDVVRTAIQTFNVLYKKDSYFKIYSIETHKTFSNYILPVYRRYGSMINKQTVYFLNAVFSKPPQNYSKEYLQLIKLIINMLKNYEFKLSQLLIRNEWNQQEFGQPIQNAIQSFGVLFGIMSRILGNAKDRWLVDFLLGNDLVINSSYFQVIDKFSIFGQRMLNDLFINRKTSSQYYNLFENTMKMMSNLFAFFGSAIQKSTLIDGEISCIINQISGKLLQTLKLIETCQENKIFIHAQRSLLVSVQNTQQICLFLIDNILQSEFDNYENFSKQFIFYTSNEGQQIQLLDLLNYILNTSHNEKILYQVFQVIFSLLKLEISYEESFKFIKLKQMIEKILEFLIDIILTIEIKINIVNQFCSYFADANKRSLGSVLKIDQILLNYLGKLEYFISNQYCSLQLFKKIQSLILQGKRIQQNSYNS